MAMKFPPFLRPFVALGFLALACGEGDEPIAPPDSGTSADAGTRTDAGETVDSGQPTVEDDAGTTVDAGSDVDSGSDDAGTAVDAGTSVDAGSTVDAGTSTDAGSATDAGSSTDGGSATDAGTIDGPDSDGGVTQIRLMAANLTSGNGQSYDPGHGIRLMQGVDPDVVMIQEFNYKSNSAADIRAMVDTAFGTGFFYYRETGAQIPNGVISRYPIIESGEWTDTQVSNRDFAWARINIPGPRDLWVVSVHLLTSGSGVRNTEATNLVKFIKANIPTSDYLAIGGDFNTDSRSEACFTTFKQVVNTASPYPADKNGNGGTNAGRSKPYDHVLVDDDLRQFQVSTVIGNSTFAGGLVLDSRVYTPISEISPALSSDSGAASMQHMGVVKTYVTPNF
ncbi:endonuclease [Corallococcus exercitus]|uniref:endonuclease/exonuclease/phosphatase family protein n=1 Tax=Corallococcus exercitus TaxID=2316736 RepID=UPI000EA3A077|nr:endonuclease/exonuclease/phosphatase family protein [Corallococcus exercitus]RKG79828.1 endonuclease [Corallococcus exercitus]